MKKHIVILALLSTSLCATAQTAGDTTSKAHTSTARHKRHRRAPFVPIVVALAAGLTSTFVASAQKKKKEAQAEEDATPPEV